MGTTPKPLYIVVMDRDMLEWPEIKTLQAQKHTVAHITDGIGGDSAWPGLDNVDLILGRKCWRMDESLRKYLDTAIGEARSIKYPKKKP